MKVPFSWEKYKANVIKNEIARAMTQAKRGSAQDKLDHPDWVREAQNNNYMNLKKVVREKFEKYQEDALLRRLKRAGKG